ncbi:MAG: RimK family alpha-L-glutamate ligase [Vulcanisaeta sp.]|uniref:RimK family alpha-L-glutamate ligase n=1 Tax=Vulcanisaeta sp. TaxID=2020871 RepID=UPI003D0F379A
MYDVLRTEEKLLMSEFRRLGVDVELISVDNISMSLNEDWNNAGIILVRPLSHFKASLIARILNIHGIKTINSGMAIENSWNKAVAISILARSGVPAVPTKLMFSEMPQEDGVNYPAIIKPLHGSWGRLVSLVSSADELKLILKHKAFGDTYLRASMIQPFIGDGTDYRIFVVGNEVIASMIRRPVENEWRSNVARGGKAEAVRLGNEVYEMAIRAVEALGLDYAGVDVLYSREYGYVVNEVNAIPEFKGLMSVSGVNIARKIAEYVLNLARR